MAIKTSIQSYIRRIEDYSDEVKQNLILEGEALAQEMSITAPKGVTGHLKDSIHTTVYTGALKSSVAVISDVEYAYDQDVKELRHVPKNQLGKKSFRNYGSAKWARTTTPSKHLKRKKEKKKGTKSGWALVNYQRGYQLALEGEVPFETYSASYVEKAVQNRGGFKAIKKRIFGIITK